MRPAITREQVFSAANLLVTQGKGVTVDAVREITGGSDRTVNQFLRLWKALRGEPLRVPLSEDEVKYVLSELIKLKSESIGLQEANRALVEQAKHDEAEITHMRGQIEARENERAELKEMNAKSERERKAQLSDRADIERQLADSRETVKTMFFCAEQSDAESNRVRTENEQLKMELAKERELNACLKQEVDDYHQRILNRQAKPPSPPSFEAPDPG